MDRVLEKKPFIVRFRNILIAGVLFVAFIIYVLIASSGAQKLRINLDEIGVEEVVLGKFQEYVDAEGIVHPILTLQVNAGEAGNVERIVGEEGMMIEKGDTILQLTNNELKRSIEDQTDDWDKQLVGFREKEIEMKQKTLNLKQQMLQTAYELKRLEKSYILDEEEYKMGVQSKAQLEVARDEYEYKKANTALQLEGLRYDSTVTLIRQELMKSDLEREKKKYFRSSERLDNLIVTAPVSGQLSFVKVTPGQKVGNGENVAVIKVLEQFKIHTALGEYYIDRVITGLPASISYQGEKYPLRVTKVVPEIKDRNFDVDLVFTQNTPDNLRIGKSYRVQIELGQAEEVVMIPRGDFFQYTGGLWIYKVNEGGDKAVKVPISVGLQNPKHYEILEGLKAGEQVIVSGYDKFGDAEELILN